MSISIPDVSAAADAYDNLTCEVEKCESLSELLVQRLTNMNDAAALCVIAEDLGHHFRLIREHADRLRATKGGA
jgi:hypothetical protein